jgi:excisionase family DNA binding protein
VEGKKLLSTAEAGQLLKISHRWVLELIRRGVIPSERIGGVHVINRDDIANLSWKRTPGRAKKTDFAQAACQICGKEIPSGYFCANCKLSPKIESS